MTIHLQQNTRLINNVNWRHVLWDTVHIPQWMT